MRTWTGSIAIGPVCFSVFADLKYRDRLIDH
jgi:hypothetical protein